MSIQQKIDHLEPQIGTKAHTGGAFTPRELIKITVCEPTEIKEAEDMYKVLIAYATRMGSTREIAAAIGEVLTDAGCDVDVQPCERARHAGAYDAVIIGSALYLGRWEKSGTKYLRRNAWALSEVPTWLFQSGPCGNSTISEVETPRAIKQLSDQIGLEKPQTFGGKLDRTKATGPLSRWMATGTFSGDFRDWEQIRQWATSVAHHLNSDNVSVVNRMNTPTAVTTPLFLPSR